MEFQIRGLMSGEDVDLSAPVVEPPPMEGIAQGEVTVDFPETQSGPMLSKFTTYLFKGTLGAEAFSARKRFSDFIWLLKALQNHFPGLLLPSLPKKQLQGRFDERFIEARRRDLEKFMQQCLRSRPIVFGSPLLGRFLRTNTGQELEAVKKIFDARPAAEMLSDYRAALVQEIGTVHDLPSAVRQQQCRQYATEQVKELQAMSKSFHAALSAHRQAAKLTNKAVSELDAMCRRECPEDAEAPWPWSEAPSEVERPRPLTFAILQDQAKVLRIVPHCEVMVEAVDAELEVADAMWQAFASFDALGKRVEEVRKKIAALRSWHVKLSDGSGSKRAQMMDMLRMDRGGKLDTAVRDIDAAIAEEAMLVEWLQLATTVMAVREIPSFVKGAVAVQQWYKAKLAQVAGLVLADSAAST